MVRNTYKLYIDDLRTPRTKGWIVVRSYEEFISTILDRGIPEEISFDHDLGWDYKENKELRSGYDCAKWLVENDIVINNFNVHSANPVGAMNIRCLLENFQKFKSKYTA